MAWSGTDRVRGRRGVEQRKRRLLLFPLCTHCFERGITRQTDEIDHITPLALGGTDTDDNCQGLCSPCHATKSASEDASHGGAATHPDWLKKSAIPITIVCGPPCGGKTTYVKQHVQPGDTVIDLDTIRMDMVPGYIHWTKDVPRDLIDGSIRRRNAMLGALSRAARGHAWFIVSAPSKAEREWWQAKLGGEVVLLHPGVDECKRRAIERGTPLAVKGVDKWERKARQPWAARTPRTTYGLDGWPAEG